MYINGSFMNTYIVRMYINRKMDWVYYFVFSQIGDSPLHRAAYWDHLQVVKLLIQNGASSTQCNNVSVIVKQVITNLGMTRKYYGRLNQCITRKTAQTPL